MKGMIEAWGTRRWNERWKDTPHYTQTKAWLPNIEPSIFPYFRGLTRKELGKSIQFITGHNGLLRHEAKLNKELTSTACRLCDDGIEDAIHLWSDCNIVADYGGASPITTHQTPSNRTSGDRTITWTPEQLSRFLRTPIIASLLIPEREEHKVGGPMPV